MYLYRCFRENEFDSKVKHTHGGMFRLRKIAPSRSLSDMSTESSFANRATCAEITRRARNEIQRVQLRGAVGPGGSRHSNWHKGTGAGAHANALCGLLRGTAKYTGNCSSVVRHGAGSRIDAAAAERDAEREPGRRAVRGEVLRRLGRDDGQPELGAAAPRKDPADFRHLSGLHAAGLPDRRLRRRLPIEVCPAPYRGLRRSVFVCALLSGCGQSFARPAPKTNRKGSIAITRERPETSSSARVHNNLRRPVLCLILA